MVSQFEPESLKSLEQIERFLAGSAELDVGFPDRKVLYRHIEQTLRRFCYEALSKPSGARCGATWSGPPACLRPGLSLEQLDAEAYARSDNEGAAQLYEALEALFLGLPYERMAVA